MKKYFTFVSLLVLVIFIQPGCSTSTEKKPPYETSKVDLAKAKNEQLSGCYMMTLQRDTALMEIKVDGAVVAGTLSYTPFEKDKSRGTVHGFISKDILKTWYTFQSEGTTSVREIYFKIINGKLAEGYGDVEMSHDSIHFKYPANLNYEEQHPFSKIDCK